MSKSTEDSNALTLHNLIAAGTLIKGEIITDGDFRIDGRVEGNIVSKGRIIIGDHGTLSGNIQAKNVDIMGLVEGKIQVSDTLSLKSTGKIQGDIITKTLIIEQNATFNGTCQMGNNNAVGTVTPENKTSEKDKTKA